MGSYTKKYCGYGSSPRRRDDTAPKQVMVPHHKTTVKFFVDKAEWSNFDSTYAGFSMFVDFYFPCGEVGVPGVPGEKCCCASENDKNDCPLAVKVGSDGLCVMDGVDDRNIGEKKSVFADSTWWCEF